MRKLLKIKEKPGAAKITKKPIGISKLKLCAKFLASFE